MRADFYVSNLLCYLHAIGILTRMLASPLDNRLQSSHDSHLRLSVWNLWSVAGGYILRAHVVTTVTCKKYAGRHVKTYIQITKSIRGTLCSNVRSQGWTDVHRNLLIALMQKILSLIKENMHHRAIEQNTVVPDLQRNTLFNSITLWKYSSTCSIPNSSKCRDMSDFSFLPPANVTTFLRSHEFPA